MLVRKLTVLNSDVSVALAKVYAHEACNPELSLDERIKAQNHLCSYLERLITVEAFDEFDNFCLKATTPEICDEAVRLVQACR